MTFEPCRTSPVLSLPVVSENLGVSYFLRRLHIIIIMMSQPAILVHDDSRGCAPKNGHHFHDKICSIIAVGPIKVVCSSHSQFTTHALPHTTRIQVSSMILFGIIPWVIQMNFNKVHE